MYQRKPLIMGNWKMNGNKALVHAFLESASELNVPGVDIAICPPVTLLSEFKGHPIKVGAQNVSEHESGAFTGELSANMLAESGCSYVIIGHSERRELYSETNEQIVGKVKQAVEYGLVPVVCVGEPIEVRSNGKEENYVGKQLDALVDGLQLPQLESCVIAYEPIWAIGTGETASPEQAQAMHAFIRNKLAQRDTQLGQNVRILYGGSVKAENAKELFSQQDIDGGLVGGASLDKDSFVAICQSAN